MEALSDIAAREAAATPGPWRWVDGAMVADAVGDERDFDVNWSVEPPLPCSPTRIIETDSGAYPPREPDALFIAHARTDIPFLLGEVSRLTAALALAEESARAIGTLSKALGNPCLPFSPPDKTLPDAVVEYALARLATAQAEGFEAGKEAAAKVCEDTAKMWRSEARATNRRDYATNELTMAAVYETAARNIRALKRGDQ